MTIYNHINDFSEKLKEKKSNNIFVDLWLDRISELQDDLAFRTVCLVRYWEEIPEDHRMEYACLLMDILSKDIPISMSCNLKNSIIEFSESLNYFGERLKDVFMEYCKKNGI